MNEVTWKRVMDWEQLHCDTCSYPTLLKFQGKPHDLRCARVQHRPVVWLELLAPAAAPKPAFEAACMRGHPLPRTTLAPAARWRGSAAGWAARCRLTGTTG
jgi:hypothetical protein